jgi:hypothetical protein
MANRIDDLIGQIEKLHAEAHDIIDLHVEEIREVRPSVPFTTIKAREVLNRAGSTVNIVEALKLIREKHREYLDWAPIDAALEFAIQEKGNRTND